MGQKVGFELRECEFLFGGVLQVGGGNYRVIVQGLDGVCCGVWVCNCHDIYFLGFGYQVERWGLGQGQGEVVLQFGSLEGLGLWVVIGEEKNFGFVGGL